MFNDKFTYGPVRKTEKDTLMSIISQSLHIPEERIQMTFSGIGLENFRCMKDGKRIVAGLGIYPMAQWFGGTKVPMAGITHVGVAPEYRGKGAAKALLVNLLRELHERQYPISGLYPATLRLYRSVGYGRSGSRISYELHTDVIDVADRSLDMVPAEQGDEQAIFDAFAAQARQSAGLLERHPVIWRRRLEQKGQLIHKYLIKCGNRIEGYVLFAQSGQRMQEPMLILDYCVLTRNAGRRLLTFFADHRTMIPRVEWAGGPFDPLVYLLPEQKVKITGKSDWMTRIIHVKTALETRGYASGLQGELHLCITDEILPWNNGCFILRLQNGKLQVEPGGEGRINLGIRELAALYTGFQTPYELRLTGLFEAPEEDMGLAAMIFAGPRPWMSEIY
ncbi:GCN5-related N-acetyltransferase [Syntrophobotulus glycolicus DSM 8271]|uniref:GCN5-related N-acetyltransferase n=1 Tax=Syntrophobotulus glycolicus (strain DSM 8271 / FlGlyR) TaxID=645991 RepID=F0SXU8_SYNGF|nr:GNAT family N-acetyltransferase [Syntrophobotulus glycolicus]ADY57009.1 GCN5-related N-acetyltransferase [Syntrophobotulus glycolicus DSM 8271]